MFWHIVLQNKDLHISHLVYIFEIKKNICFLYMPI